MVCFVHLLPEKQSIENIPCVIDCHDYFSPGEGGKVYYECIFLLFSFVVLLVFPNENVDCIFFSFVLHQAILIQ